MVAPDILSTYPSVFCNSTAPSVLLEFRQMKMVVKEEVIEQDDDDDDNTEETRFYIGEEEAAADQITVSQYSVSSDSTLDSFPGIEQRNTMQTKQKFVSISKRFSDHTQKTKQVVSDDRWKTTRNKRKRAMDNHLYDPVKVKSSVVRRAEEVQAKLGSKFPSIIRPMLRSNVIRGFWMNFPRRFCNLHLPKHDTSVILVDEKGEEYRTNFLVHKSGLSGGWKAYCTAHNLREGDVLVFQFVRPSECKVYTLRSYELTEVDGALGLLYLAASKMGFERDMKTGREAHQKCLDSVSLDLTQENTQKNALNLGSVADESEIISHDLGSNNSETMRCSGSSVDFKDVQSIENFSILVNGFNIAPEISEYHRSNYYKLCCQQNLYLHDRLLENINSKWAAEIISETCNIADAIGACKLSTSHADYAITDKTLEDFELLGMNVGFLRARLNRHVSLAYKSEEASEHRRCREAVLEGPCLKEDRRSLELKDATERIDAKMLNLKVKSHKHGLLLQEELDMQW